MGLESHVYQVIKRDAPRLWGDFYFDNGLVPHNSEVAKEIVDILKEGFEPELMYEDIRLFEELFRDRR